MKRVAVIGAALSANKGAAAMVETVVARLPGFMGPCSFDVLTTYPAEDEGRLPAGAGARVVGLQPLRLALVEFPVACLVLVSRLLRIPTVWARTRAVRSLLDADVCVDVAGISFVDGRGLPITVYNALMTGLPLMVGTPTVKAAQAMGPFRTNPNRFLARSVLPRLSSVCARGARTVDHLSELGLTNVVEVADLAFSLEETGVLPEPFRSALEAIADGYVVVMPSSVVRGLRASKDADYVAEMVALVRQIRKETGLTVVVAPHSYRAGRPEGRMNDGPVCREVVAAFAPDEGVLGIDGDLTAGELRSLIKGAQVLVTSRFHAMISGLATSVPTIVVGWSHKYREVLADFAMEDMGMDADSLSEPAVVVSSVGRALVHRAEISDRIREALPAVRAKSERNFVVIAAASR